MLFTFLDAAPAVCKAINERLYKDDTIPVTTLDPSKVFINGGGDDIDFASGACADCVGKVSYCVQASDGTYAFYNVLVAQ